MKKLRPTVCTVGAFEAKTHLSRLLREVQAGQHFVITQRGKPVAEIRPPSQSAQRGKRGDLRGKIRMADDFCAALPELEKHLS